MKKLLILLLAFSYAGAIEQVGKPPPQNQAYAYKTKWFNQRVDHFNFVRNDFFKQKYLINDTFWDSQRNGPIFFYTGNEGDIEAFAQNSVIIIRQVYTCYVTTGFASIPGFYVGHCTHVFSFAHLRRTPILRPILALWKQIRDPGS